MMKLHRVAVGLLLASGLLAAKLGIAQANTQASPAINAETLRPLLNSERITLKFGSYGIKVVQNGEKIRVSNLYSESDNKQTTRTLAVVVYPEMVAPAFKQEHQQIVAGGSIGATFKKSGWKINKQHTYFGEIAASPKLSQLYQLMGGIKPTGLAMHLYQLNVSKEGNQFHYATIAEVHHPAYLTSKDLQAIYKDQYQQLQKQSNTINVILNTVKEKLASL
ncbi:hypothetical protein [Spartinivicinus poritis]|uniref:Uncharacterized protein n=1 Tax=Spartinivicinus poritis TaxID=2994640 RepID=A0ABT5UAH3_9GAMM|nr:hypothetical protein [Spartinivicinus sp. A2-2]MDE1463385.1 hypothetical protein [Spartinivicinus sp. A2-2]